jgi:hypothetical protein
MKFVIVGDNLVEPCKTDIPEYAIENPVDYVLNLFRQDMLYPNPVLDKNKTEVLSYRAWYEKIGRGGPRPLYDIWEEYATGTIENQQYFKNEYLGRAV